MYYITTQCNVCAQFNNIGKNQKSIPIMVNPSACISSLIKMIFLKLKYHYNVFHEFWNLQIFHLQLIPGTPEWKKKSFRGLKSSISNLGKKSIQFVLNNNIFLNLNTFVTDLSNILIYILEHFCLKRIFIRSILPRRQKNKNKTQNRK